MQFSRNGMQSTRMPLPYSYYPIAIRIYVRVHHQLHQRKSEFKQHKFHNEIRKSQSLELWESCQWQPAMVSKHNIIFYMLRLFYKVVWLWGHGHHARRASKITFVQRPNTSAVCTHGTQAAMLKNFSWKIFTPNSLRCQQIDSWADFGEVTAKACRSAALWGFPAFCRPFFHWAHSPQKKLLKGRQHLGRA